MGTVVTAVAKTTKLVKYASKAAKIVRTCRDIGRIGNVAAGMKALYDTYQTAERECETTGKKIAYIAGTVIIGYLVGKAANKGAEVLKKFALKEAKLAGIDNKSQMVIKFTTYGQRTPIKIKDIVEVGFKKGGNFGKNNKNSNKRENSFSRFKKNLYGFVI